MGGAGVRAMEVVAAAAVEERGGGLQRGAFEDAELFGKLRICGRDSSMAVMARINA